MTGPEKAGDYELLAMAGAHPRIPEPGQATSFGSIRTNPEPDIDRPDGWLTPTELGASIKPPVDPLAVLNAIHKLMQEPNGQQTGHAEQSLPEIFRTARDPKTQRTGLYVNPAYLGAITQIVRASQE